MRVSPAREFSHEGRVYRAGEVLELPEEMATHSSIFVWEITWTDESGVLDLGVAKSRT